MIKKKTILILPRWYPNVTDIQLGSFIQQQAILLKDSFTIHVIYVQAIAEITSKNQKFEVTQTTENGIDERLVYFKQSKGIFRKIINAQRYKKAQEIAFNLDPINPDLCHVHVPYRSGFLALKLNKSGVPFVITEHWSGHLNGEFDKKNVADKKLYDSFLRKAAGISTVSQLLRDSFKKNTGFDSEVIPNFIQAGTPLVNFTSEKIELLCVADLVDETKNISGLLTAFAEARKKNNKLKLTIIGGGPDENILLKLANDLGLEDDCHFTGRKSFNQVQESYAKCHFYICNSNFETFGMAVAESLSAGKPVICTDCGGPTEYLSNENSLVIATRNDSQLTDAILHMADSFSEYNAELVSRDLLVRFGAETVREKLVTFYKKAFND